MPSFECAHSKVVNAPVGRGVTILGDPAVTIFDLAQRIKRISGCRGEIVFVPRNYVDVELRIPNVEKARETLGFAAAVELDDGLERTIAWHRERLASATA